MERRHLPERLKGQARAGLFDDLGSQLWYFRRSRPGAATDQMAAGDLDGDAICASSWG